MSSVTRPLLRTFFSNFDHIGVVMITNLMYFQLYKRWILLLLIKKKKIYLITNSYGKSYIFNRWYNYQKNIPNDAISFCLEHYPDLSSDYCNTTRASIMTAQNQQIWNLLHEVRYLIFIRCWFLIIWHQPPDEMMWRLRVSVLSVIIHSETVLYCWKNNGELVTRLCKQSNKANLLREGYWNTWLTSRLIIQEHIVEYVERTLLKLLLKSFNIFTIVGLDPSVH